MNCMIKKLLIESLKGALDQQNQLFLKSAAVADIERKKKWCRFL